MKTPITDAAEFATHQATRFHHGEDPLVDASLARRLELDRAALMEALETIFKASIGGCSPDASDEFCDIVLDLAENALSTARANFPTE